MCEFVRIFATATNTKYVQSSIIPFYNSNIPKTLLLFEFKLMLLSFNCLSQIGQAFRLEVS